MTTSIDMTEPVECPGCGQETEVEFTYHLHIDHHPYGSTTASEETYETEAIEDKCHLCGTDLTNELEAAAEKVSPYDYMD